MMGFEVTLTCGVGPWRFIHIQDISSLAKQSVTHWASSSHELFSILYASVSSFGKQGFQDQPHCEYIVHIE